MEYQDLYQMIPSAFERFSFSNYYHDEKRYLYPALAAMGYTSIYFIDGERDSFGPLSRVCIARRDGIKYKFVYG